MKDIKDYLHLYLGCDVQVKRKNDKEYLIGRICEVTKESNHGDWIDVRFNDVVPATSMIWEVSNSNFHTFFFNHDEIKPILRPLSDMDNNPEHWETYSKLLDGQPGKPGIPCKADAIAYLLSLHYDLFNLIPEGLAIDKTKL